MSQLVVAFNHKPSLVELGLLCLAADTTNELGIHCCLYDQPPAQGRLGLMIHTVNFPPVQVFHYEWV